MSLVMKPEIQIKCLKLDLEILNNAAREVATGLGAEVAVLRLALNLAECEIAGIRKERDRYKPALEKIAARGCRGCLEDSERCDSCVAAEALEGV